MTSPFFFNSVVFLSLIEVVVASGETEHFLLPAFEAVAAATSLTGVGGRLRIDEPLEAHATGASRMAKGSDGDFLLPMQLQHWKYR